MSKQQITIPIFIPHLGCRHRCIFCNQHAATGSYSHPSVCDIDARVHAYLSHRKKSIDRIELAFFGGSFTGMDPENQKVYLAAARRHREEGNINGIRLSTRPDYISRESLTLLAEHGVTTIELGVQSLDDTVLGAARRGHSAADVFRAVDLITSFNFDFVIQLMPGLPGENRESAIKTAETAALLRPSAARIYPAVVLAGTGLEQLYRKGSYRPLSLDEAVELCRDIFLVFQMSNIPVIRMGLHPFPPGEACAVIAGPYHPAFGSLVRSRVRRQEMAERLLAMIASSGQTDDGSLQLAIPEYNAADYIGNNKENMNYLKRLFNYRKVVYSVENISEFRVVSC